MGGHSRYTPHPADDGWSRRWLQEFSSSRGNYTIILCCCRRLESFAAALQPQSFGAALQPNSHNRTSTIVVAVPPPLQFRSRCRCLHQNLRKIRGFKNGMHQNGIKRGIKRETNLSTINHLISTGAVRKW